MHRLGVIGQLTNSGIFRIGGLGVIDPTDGLAIEVVGVEGLKPFFAF